MELSDDDFEWITTEVAALGGGNLPIVSVLEGGYNVDALEGAVRAHLHALINS
jgi:acetoin utilization deacetylase AcuC-like enzyme